MKFLKKNLPLLIINISIFIFLLLLLEGTSRLLVPVKEKEAIFNDTDLRVRNRPFVEHNPTRGFSLKPNYHSDMYNINKLGFRENKLNENTTNSFSILAIGESTTFGWAVKDDETYPYYLSKSFKSNHIDAYVINAGVPSYTSSQVLLYLEEIINSDITKPNMILVNIMWNDIWYSTVQNWYKDLLVYQRPPLIVEYLSKYSHLFNIITKKLSKSEKKVDVFNQKALDFYASNLKDIISMAKNNNIQVVFVEPPFDADHMPQKGLNEFHVTYTKPFFIEVANAYLKRLQTIAEKYNIQTISHSLGIQNLHQKNLFIDSLHPTANGNKIMADEIFEALSVEKR